MNLQVTISAIFIAICYGSPIDSQGTNYLSSSLGLGAYRTSGHEGLNYGVQYSRPVITEHEIVSPIIKKVPIIVKSYAEEEEKDEVEHGPAEYAYTYGIEDKHTGDIKSHKESRHGDVVQGEYSFKEADGTIRTVKYTVDKKSGFNAVVTRTGHAAHPQVEHKKVVLKPIVVPSLHEDEHYSYH